MIDKPGIYDIPFEQYLGKGLTPTPPLSASVIKTMLNQSPRHAANEHRDIGGKHDESSSKVASIGTVAHAIIMKQEDKRIAVIPYPEFRTNEAKAWRDGELAAGKIVIKEDAYNDAAGMAAAFRPTMAQYTAELGEEFPTSDFEKTVVVKIGDVWCKIRIDALGQSLWDLKSTGTEYLPEKWVKNQLFGPMKYDITVAFYKRVWKELTGEDKRFILAVCEQNDPFDAYPVIVDDFGLEDANEQIEWALRTWSAGLKTGKWAGYAGGRVIYASPPPWNRAEWELFKQREKTMEAVKQAEAA